MKILLTFTGFHDPYSKGLLGEVEQAGPILSLVKARSFDIVFLLSTPNTVEHTAATQATLSGQTEVREVFVQLQDPTDYGMILRALRSITSKVVEDYPGAEYFVSVASGTPQMHACWVLLVAAGEFPAHILHVRPPRFVTSDAPLVSEIDVGGEDFPTICRPMTSALHRGWLAHCRETEVGRLSDVCIVWLLISVAMWISAQFLSGLGRMSVLPRHFYSIRCGPQSGHTQCE